MTDRPGSPDTGDDDGRMYDREPSAGIPRWVKVGVIALVILALLAIVVMLLTGGGGHGPGRHAMAVNPAEQWR